MSWRKALIVFPLGLLYFAIGFRVFKSKFLWERPRTGRK
jgi:hypothetical protein